MCARANGYFWESTRERVEGKRFTLTYTVCGPSNQVDRGVEQRLSCIATDKCLGYRSMTLPRDNKSINVLLDVI